MQRKMSARVAELEKREEGISLSEAKYAEREKALSQKETALVAIESEGEESSRWTRLRFGQRELSWSRLVIRSHRRAPHWTAPKRAGRGSSALKAKEAILSQQIAQAGSIWYAGGQGKALAERESKLAEQKDMLAAKEAELQR